MVKKKTGKPSSIQNRRARFDYELGDSFLAGIQLSGAETKSLRMGHGHLRGAYVNIRNNELWLINATINGTSGIPIGTDQQNRDRKLLIKRREFEALTAARQQGRTIVPLELLVSGRYIKVRIAVGKGKKNYDKRQTMKARDDARRTQADLKLAR